MSDATRGDELAAALGRRLGGTVHDLHRLSGGASRVTSAFDLEADGGGRRPLILQVERGRGPTQGKMRTERDLLDAAGAAGVPVPRVVAMGEDDDIGPAWLVVERLDGETIPRKLLRDVAWATARGAPRPPSAGAPWPPSTPSTPTAWRACPGPTRCAIPCPCSMRWARCAPPSSSGRAGSPRTGPSPVPASPCTATSAAATCWSTRRDCAACSTGSWRTAATRPRTSAGSARRPGASADPERWADSAGSTSCSARTATRAAAPSLPARVHWWQVYATVKWAAICALQAATHLGGLTRSVELAAIGRRVCESEWDLFVLLGVTPPADRTEPVPAVGPLPPFGRPTAAELVEAVREYLDGVTDAGEGAAGFEARVARNALAVVERELRLGPALARAHTARLAALGFDDDAALAAALRAGTLDDAWDVVAPALAASARDQLRVANPSYLPPESA